MSQPLTLQAPNCRGPLRIGHIICTVLALLSCALGSVFLSPVRFGVGVTVTTSGKEVYPYAEGRTFAFLYDIWLVISAFLLHIGGVMFTVFFMLLNTGAIWLASRFLRKRVEGHV